MKTVTECSAKTYLVNIGDGYKVPIAVLIANDYTDDGVVSTRYHLDFSNVLPTDADFMSLMAKHISMACAVTSYRSALPLPIDAEHQVYGNGSVQVERGPIAQYGTIDLLKINGVYWGEYDFFSYTSALFTACPLIVVYDAKINEYFTAKVGTTFPDFKRDSGFGFIKLLLIGDTYLELGIRDNLTIPYLTIGGRYWSNIPKKYNFTTGAMMPAVFRDLVNNSPYIGGDPYMAGGTSGTGGGTGTFSDTGDSVDFPSLPTLSAVDTGFVTLYNPTLAQMQSLASYMWSDLFDLDTFRKLLADPMDAILGLSIVPVAVPDGGAQSVTVGNISTGVSMNKAASQYVEVDCGSLSIEEYWGAYLDYDPYTKAELYLPYCGTHAIAVDDIMGKTVHIKYHVDILSGACCCYVKCGESVLYTFVGQCSSSIPISAGDYTNVINGIITVAASVGSLVATGGASAPTAIPALASTAVNSMKPTIEKSGSMSGTGGMLAVQTPYLIVTRPKQALPTDQNTFTGYPSFINENLGDLSGFTQVEEIRLTGMSASDAEISEIETLLKSGVIF